MPGAVIEHRAVRKKEIEPVAFDLVQILEKSQRELAILGDESIGIRENFAGTGRRVEHERTSVEVDVNTQRGRSALYKQYNCVKQKINIRSRNLQKFLERMFDGEGVQREELVTNKNGPQ